jgi:hypothetical protein
MPYQITAPRITRRIKKAIAPFGLKFRSNSRSEFSDKDGASLSINFLLSKSNVLAAKVDLPDAPKPLD